MDFMPDGERNIQARLIDNIGCSARAMHRLSIPDNQHDIHKELCHFAPAPDVSGLSYRFLNKA